MLPAAVWSLPLLVAGAGAEFQCSEQNLASVSGSESRGCHCELSANYKYEMYCPTVTDSKVHFKFEPEKYVVMTCSPSHPISPSALVSLVSSLSPLGSVPSVRVTNCPIPVDPLAALFGSLGLNVSAVEVLQMNYVPRQSSEDLQGYHFQNFTGLRILELTKLKIKKIDKTFFEHITQIQGLDLTQNQGIRIDGSSFTELQKLVEFTCHSCYISDLPGNLFSGLSNLKMISLHDNKIGTINPGTFDTNTALEVINLAKNTLQTLPNNIFDNLVNLTSAVLSYNNFNSLPDRLFKLNRKMKIFEMHVNGNKNPVLGYPLSGAKKMNLPSSMFPESLETIRMLWVLVNGVPEDFLQGCTNLVNVTIQNAMITELPEKVFQDAPKLKLIDFSANSLTSLPPKIFKGLNQVEKLRFIANKLSTLDENLLQDFINLKVIHLDENQLESLPKNIFAPTKSLEELDLSQNKLSFSQVDFTKGSTFPKLRILDLSQNNLTYITDPMMFLMLNLRTLNLSHNSIGDHRPWIGENGSLVNLNFLERNDFVVDLSYNSIQRLLFQNVDIVYNSNNSRGSPIKLNITNNPLKCDCKTVELKQISDGTMTGVLKNFFKLEPETLKCSGDNDKQTRHKFLSEVTYRDLNCEVAECSDQCRCSLNRYYRETHMDCSNSAMTTFPSQLVLVRGSDTISLDMSSNRITNVSRAVESFYNSSVARHYANITRLYLSHNQIQTFNQESLPPALEELYLDNNQIHGFKHSDINFFDSLTDRTQLRLKLSRNPYTCDCESTALYHFVRNKGGYIEDRHLISLACDPDSLALWSAKLEDFCQYELPTPFIILIIALLIIACILALVAVGVYKRDIVVIWVYAQPWGKKLFTEDIIDKEKPYDAFISYSQADSEYVEQQLLPGLETPADAASPRFKCLIHTRDWSVGEMIPDQILHSVESSRRTIIVLSPAYIDSMWTKLEFRAAHKQALQDRTQRVIIVVLGELPVKDDMEEDLKKYISLNTYLEADDPWFWQKLRFALPHRGGRMTRARTRRETDKLELMRSQAELELGKRTPSPKNLDPKTLLHDHQPNGHVNNGFANGAANGHVAVVNGHANGHVAVPNGHA